MFSKQQPGRGLRSRPRPFRRVLGFLFRRATGRGSPQGDPRCAGNGAKSAGGLLGQGDVMDSGSQVATARSSATRLELWMVAILVLVLTVSGCAGGTDEGKAEAHTAESHTANSL